MAGIMSQTLKKSKSIYTSEIKGIRTRVEKCYENLKHKDIKFTEDMIILIELDFMDHFDCKLSDVDRMSYWGPVTKRYLQECNSRLKNYNPIKVKQNLRKMNLL